jgi:molecular chaperone DnaJ
VVELFIETPTKLSARQKELLREFAGLCGDQQHPRNAAFFNKARRFWEDITGAGAEVRN